MTPRHAEQPSDAFDAEAEGVPDIEGLPPGIDADLAQEGMIPPSDVPLGSASWGTTEGEERQGESLEQRVAQELPEDTGYHETGLEGRLEDNGTGDTQEVGVMSDDTAGMSAEEAAVHVRDEP
ncbi:MAG: hypothetical protein M0Z87_11995 [Actinomycetota bacterium]|nr:hypothetical protein [Actinomycetota bacterium]